MTEYFAVSQEDSRISYFASQKTEVEAMPNVPAPSLQTVLAEAQAVMNQAMERYGAKGHRVVVKRYALK